MTKNTEAAWQGGARQNVLCSKRPADSTATSPSASPAPATQAPTRKCSHYGERFTLVARRGRNSDKRHGNAKRSYHLGTRYCSAVCRYAAHEARRNRLRRNASTVGQSGVKNAVKFAPGPNVPSTVGHANFFADISSGYNGQNWGRASPKKPVLDPRIVPDPKWPGMYRVRRPNDSLTDMVNLMRTKDALAKCRGVHERHRL